MPTSARGKSTKSELSNHRVEANIIRPQNSTPVKHNKIINRNIDIYELIL